MTVSEYLINLGYTTIDGDFRNEIDTWGEWYKGQTAFHSYSVFNGRLKRDCKREFLGMAKKVSEDWANLILNERVQINPADERFAEAFKTVLAFNNFQVRGNQLMELTFALGTGATVEYLDIQSRVVIDYIRASMIFPISWDNGEITECAFASQRQYDGEDCYYINLHLLENGKYKIINKMINKETGTEMLLTDGLIPEIYTNSERPRFQIYMPNICNNIDLDCPMGISVYANAISNLKNCDMVFDSYNNEFRLGKKRILIPTTMTQIAMSDAGTMTPIFDDNDTEFYALNVSGNSTIDKPVEINMELRADAHEKGLQTALNLLSDKCGLGTDRYEYQASSGVKTATEIVSEKSALFQNLKKHELVTERALINMTATVAEMMGYNPDMAITINFDDSIIQDTDSIRQQALLEFNSGLIDEVEYFVRVYNLTEDEAIKKIADMRARKEPEPGLQDTAPETDGEDTAGGVDE